MTRSLQLLALVVALLVVATPATAQSEEERREALQRIANPDLASGAEGLEFTSLTCDLGRISEDDSLVHGEFSFENHTPQPIVILRAKSSCSCVAVDYSLDVIEVGESATVRFSYLPKGYPGEISRRILLYTSLSESKPSALLTVEGYAEVSTDLAESYPYAIGALRMRQPTVSFDGGQVRQVERIMAINSGDTPLTLGAMSGQLPAGLSFWCEPQRVEAGESVDLVFAMDRDLWQGVSESYPVVVDGIDLPPSRRTIFVKIKNR